MYARLALTNAKKSMKDYIIYFVTLTICASLFYAFLSLSSSKYELITEDSYNFIALKDILRYATYVITALLALLILYVNKYIIKRRQKEFGIYMLLGIPQKNVALMFFIETLIMGIIPIFIGIFLGTLFSQAITAFILNTIDQKIVFEFKIYWDTVGITFIFFMVMFSIIGVLDGRILIKTKLINMLNAEKKVELQFKRSGLIYGVLFIIAIALYIVSGYMLNDHKSPMYVLIGLISFILATYALFYSLAYIIVYIKDKRKNFKYENTNLFLIGAIVSKIKTAPILMATISLTFLGAALSFTITFLLAQWSMGYLNMRIPFDVIASSSNTWIKDIKDIPNLQYDTLKEYFDETEYGLKDSCQVEQYLINDNDFYNKDKKNAYEVAISLSDYNHLRNMLGYSEIKLKDNEFSMQWHKMASNDEIKNYIEKNNTLNVKNYELKISDDSYNTETIGEYIYNGIIDSIIIVPDKVCEDLTLLNTCFYGNTKKKMSYDEATWLRGKYIPKWFEDNYKSLYEKYKDTINEDEGERSLGYSRLKVQERTNILNITLGMRTVGIYVGIVLLMISLTVLALQQLGDSIEHKDRFKTLTNLGVENKEINKLVLKQISIYFVVPILIASIGFIVIMKNLISLLNENEIIRTFVGFYNTTFYIILAFIIIVTLYICYFISTYYTFKRNIKNTI